MGKLLKLPTQQSKPLAKPGGGNSTALRIRGGSSAPTAATRQQMDTLKAKLAKSKENQSLALAEEAKKTEEQRQQEEFNTILEQHAAETSALVAFVLDFTASTIGDVHQFRADVASFQSRLQKAFPKGVTTIPVIARGGGYWGEGRAEVIVTSDNNLDVFNNTHNQPWRYETPIGYGIEKVASRFKQGFFSSDISDSTVKAIIAMSDNEFEQPRGYSSVNKLLKKNEVVVASLVSNGSIYIPSHMQAISNPLGEFGIVIDRSKPEMAPVDLVMEILINIRDNLHRAQAAEEVKARAAKRKTVVSPSVKQQSRSVSLADQLSLKGHAGTARSVHQGNGIKGLLR